MMMVTAVLGIREGERLLLLHERYMPNLCTDWGFMAAVCIVGRISVIVGGQLG